MANHDKRLDRQTGNYDTIEELTAEVLKMHKSRKYSRKQMGEMTGVSGATCTRIINDNKPKDRREGVDLKQLINKLWVVR